MLSNPTLLNKKIIFALAIFLLDAFVSACHLPQQPVSPTPVTETPTQVVVYFTSIPRYTLGTPPYEVAVLRLLPPGIPAPEAVLDLFFEGPTTEEKELGLELISSGFSGVERLEMSQGVAHVYMEGSCNSGGAAYTIAQPIIANLTQFPEIRAVKIYDEKGQTGNPTGITNSIPNCLEP
jgi:hypothetical protein